MASRWTLLRPVIVLGDRVLVLEPDPGIEEGPGD
jgi:hypothetical protein